MTIPITQLDYCGEPADLYCPVCGEMIFVSGVQQKSCPHLIFWGDSASGNWSWQQQQSLSEFKRQLQESYEGAVKNGFYGSAEEYMATIKVEKCATMAATIISGKSAFMLAISTSDIGCGGMYNGTIYGAFDFLPKGSSCPISSVDRH